MVWIPKSSWSLRVGTSATRGTEGLARKRLGWKAKSDLEAQR